MAERSGHAGRRVGLEECRPDFRCLAEGQGRGALRRGINCAVAEFGPCAPYRIEMCPEARLIIAEGMKNGEIFPGPPRISLKVCVAEENRIAPARRRQFRPGFGLTCFVRNRFPGVLSVADWHFCAKS